MDSTLLTPLTQFICDTCKEVIKDPKDGWFERLHYWNEERFVNENFRICHDRLACRKLDEEEDGVGTPLSQLVFPRGLPELFSLLDVGPYHQKKFLGPEVNDLREYMDILRRFTIPYYEEARQFWGQVISDDSLPPVDEVTIYTPDFLTSIIRRYTSKLGQR